MLLTMAAAAQMPAPPKPGPEQAKLGYFVGNWDMEGDTKAGPWGPGGKFTGNEKVDWLDGNFFIVIHSGFKGPMGEVKGLAVMGYDPEEKFYTYTEVNSMGEQVSSKGMLEGDTWNWTSEQKMHGQVMKSRFVIKQVSPTLYTYKFDMAPAGQELATVMEGKATKK
jgi:hypothetical protein